MLSPGREITNLITLRHEDVMSCATCIVAPLKKAITIYILYRNRLMIISNGAFNIACIIILHLNVIS